MFKKGNVKGRWCLSKHCCHDRRLCFKIGYLTDTSRCNESELLVFAWHHFQLKTENLTCNLAIHLHMKCRKCNQILSLCKLLCVLSLCSSIKNSSSLSIQNCSMLFFYRRLCCVLVHQLILCHILYYTIYYTMIIVNGKSFWQSCCLYTKPFKNNKEKHFSL